MIIRRRFLQLLASFLAFSGIGAKAIKPAEPYAETVQSLNPIAYWLLGEGSVASGHSGKYIENSAEVFEDEGTMVFTAWRGTKTEWDEACRRARMIRLSDLSRG